MISKIDYLEVLIKTENPHLILISETWLNSNISNAMLNLDNYNIDSYLRIDRNEGAEGA